MAAQLLGEGVTEMIVVVKLLAVGGAAADRKVPEADRANTGNRLSSWNAELLISIGAEFAGEVDGVRCHSHPGKSDSRFIDRRRREGVSPVDDAGRSRGDG